MVSCMILAVGCTKNNINEEDLESLRAEIEAMKSQANRFTIEKQKLNDKIELLQMEKEELLQSKEKLQEEYDEFSNRVAGIEWELYDYKYLNMDYKKYIEDNIELVQISDSQLNIAGIGIGSSYKDVANILGEPDKEQSGVNESGYGGTSSYMTWEYEDFVVGFDPLYVRSIETTRTDIAIDTKISVGDNALDALQIMDSTYTKVISNHTMDELKGWYYTEEKDIIILYYNTENKRHQNKYPLSEESTITRIELTKDFFD